MPHVPRATPTPRRPQRRDPPVTRRAFAPLAPDEPRRPRLIADKRAPLRSRRMGLVSWLGLVAVAVVLLIGAAVIRLSPEMASVDPPVDRPAQTVTFP